MIKVCIYRWPGVGKDVMVGTDLPSFDNENA